MKFNIYQDSRKGGRKNNEDRVGHFFSPESLIMVVADGMGGHMLGEVAAQMTVQIICAAFKKQATPRLRDPFMFLLKSIHSAHHAIFDYALTRNLPETPRTTVVACVVQDCAAHWAHAGDSRLYLIRDGRVAAQTRDHTRIQMLVDQGRVREEGIAAHPDRNRIFSCLGALTRPTVEFSQKTPLKNGDTLMLCTDGVWGPLSSRHIVTSLLRPDLMKAAPQLLDLAIARAGTNADNTSAVALRWLEDYSQPDERELTSAAASSTVTVQLDQYGMQPEQVLSDTEIEQAVAEIRERIRKTTR